MEKRVRRARARSRLVAPSPGVAFAVLTLLAGCSPRPGGEHGGEGAGSTEPRLVTLQSPSPMVSFKVMVRAGSTADPPGKEGLAYLVGHGIVEGGFGDPKEPVTKERLAEIVLPWGEGALPTAQVAGRATTFHFTVPRKELEEYVRRVLRPLFAEPLFLEDEVSRLKREMVAEIPAIRYEKLEDLGLAAIDAYVYEGTRWVHPPFGTETSIPELTREDARAFYREHYRPGNVIIGVSASDEEVVEPIERALRSLPEGAAPAVSPEKPRRASGRRAVVIEEPNAPAASVHLGFPIEVDRSHPDFWPLYVANTWLGTHRDSFGRLYRAIRQERGYNYGDYSYIEYWSGRPLSLFQIFNQPREHQYFSIWLRPVGHEYAHHLMKAATWELERLVREGLTEDEVAAAKKKARVLYLSLAETVHRLLAARMDDAFYGLSEGFLEGYLRNIDRVTADDVNAAVKKHLQVKDINYLVVTDREHAKDLARSLREGEVAWGKTPADYGFEKIEPEEGGGETLWKIPEEKLSMLRLDAVWAHYPLEIEEVREAPVTRLFRDGGFLSEGE